MTEPMKKPKRDELLALLRQAHTELGSLHTFLIAQRKAVIDALVADKELPEGVQFYGLDELDDVMLLRKDIHNTLLASIKITTK